MDFVKKTERNKIEHKYFEIKLFYHIKLFEHYQQY